MFVIAAAFLLEFYRVSCMSITLANYKTELSFGLLSDLSSKGTSIKGFGSSTKPKCSASFSYIDLIS